MATAGEAIGAFGVEIGDPFNSHVIPTRVLVWLNRVVAEAVRETKCLWETDRFSGLADIEIVDYSSLSADVISLKTSADSAATDYTEGSEWTAETSNTVTATNLAAALDVHPNVQSYSDGAHVYVCVKNGHTIAIITSDADTNYITVANGAEYFNLSEILTEFRRVEAVYDIANKRMYEPMDRRSYLYTQLDSVAALYTYTNPPESGKQIMKLEAGGISLLYSVSIYIDYFQKATAITTMSTDLPGLLSDYVDLIVKGILYHYYNSTGEHNKAITAKSLFLNECRLVRKDLRSHGMPLPMNQLFRVSND